MLFWETKGVQGGIVAAFLALHVFLDFGYWSLSARFAFSRWLE